MPIDEAPFIRFCVPFTGHGFLPVEDTRARTFEGTLFQYLQRLETMVEGRTTGMTSSANRSRQKCGTRRC